MKPLLLIAVLALAACGPSVADFQKPGASPSEVAADDDACRAQAQAGGPPGGRTTFLGTESEDRVTIYRRCLTARGYTPVTGK